MGQAVVWQGGAAMKRPERPPQSIWNLYKMGGITPAINSFFDAQNAQQMAFMRQMMKQQRKDFIMDTHLDTLETVVFDLETTGFYPQQGDEIISFGAIALKGEQIQHQEQFHLLVNPGREIPELITELTGISNEAVRDAPPVLEGLQQFFAFVGKRMLIAHASGHDKQFLNAILWRTSKVHMTHRILDTIQLAKWLEPKRRDFSLDALLTDRQIPITRRHDALEDSLMTAQLWVSYLQQMKERNIHTLGDLYAHLINR
jgi:DNA polymerase-3 subunit epsilon